MPDRKKLRKHYDQMLTDIWEEWDSAVDRDGIPTEGISPFTDLDDVPDLDANPGFNWSVGWVGGVAAALDWPTDRPLGPKQWSPKGRHPK